MSKPTAWMPMYWGDYLRDTQHLTTEQHGVYLLLIAHYWNTGRAPPDDEKFLRNICQISEYKFRKNRQVISAFFKVENGHWYHSRIERELLVAFDNKESAIARGKRGAAARWKGETSNGASNAHTMAHHHHLMNHESESLTDAARDPALNGGSGPRASRTETSKERLARLAMESRQALLRKGQA